jgi:7-cyano-7-deazaguanine synthase
VAFRYGQRHRVELECGKRVIAAFGAREPYLIHVEALGQLAGNALTNPEIAVARDASRGGNEFAARHGLPSTFVPGRNLLFLTLAAAYGTQLGVFDLVTGVCEADAAGYPDCRVPFVVATREAISAALGEEVRIHTPLIDSSKAETFALAERLGVLDVIVRETHTCYEGDRDRWHAWGFGCGWCPACEERANGWRVFRRTPRELVSR